ncbi:exodeoxyribonuclease VII large subunit [Haloarcula salina]|uniref:Exodeoxyribonuclease VII large subunit n=1 Tax=Haloarcula salina TaxID=1429914 RepID=A0AA41FZ99_9EURY|nr:exodeoxyribonuclease VII large subunit [Haloarcula salina]MBV0901356.1 exodeoxyribonuclease VII large subunit [Haloarcula salina]
MESEPSEAVPIETLQEALEAERVTYVDTLNADIGSLLEDAEQLRFDYVVGDVSDAGVSSNDHVHFDLVHEDSTIHCVIFSYRRKQLGLAIEDGTQVAVKGSLSYYEDGGNVSIIVDDVVEVGEGTYQRIYEQNRHLLETDGLLDPAAKKSLPELPERIGIVTSATSDARTDAITSIHDRYPDVDIVVQNATVQGDDAMLSIMGAISELDDDPLIDVIVLTRGGGADKHLRVFNETPLCRVIHRTETPIVVGVGHDNDQTLAGEVADRRVMTPTEVGLIVTEKAALEDELDALSDRLDRTYTDTVQEMLEETHDRLTRRYAQTFDSTLRAFETDLNRSYETHVRDELTSLENRLDRARTQYAQQRKREQDAERYRQQRRHFIVVLLVLALFVVALGLFILINL